MSATTFTVDDALESAGFGKFQALLLCYAGMGWVSEAMEMMLLSFVGPSVQAKWHLTSHQESLVTSVVFAGELIGAYSWGIISDSYGRRKGFLYTALVTSGAGFLSAFAPNYLSLLVLRFFVGLGLGGGPVLSSWFVEFSPAQHRGSWMVVFSFFWTVGTILEASLAWAVMPTLGWRWLLALSSLPSFFLLIFYSMVPESPRYLCTKGKTSDAFHVLEKLARTNGTMLPQGKLVLEQTVELQENCVSSEDTHLILDSKDESVLATTSEFKLGGLSTVRTLLSPGLAFTTILLWMAFFGNAFSYYGLVLLTTELNNKQTCSSNTSYPDETQKASLYRNVFIASFAEIPGLLLSAALVDRVGRKISMAAMFFFGCGFLMPLIFNRKQLLTTSLLFGARLCITGSYTIIYVYAPEIYPTPVRTTGVGVASSMARIGGMICPLVAVGLIHSCHQTVAILLFELVMLVSGIAVVLFPLETKGLQLADTITYRSLSRYGSLQA